MLREREHQRVALLVRLAHERIGVPMERASYARNGVLAKQGGAALLVKHILLAAANHIDSNPLDYLTKLARGQQRKEQPHVTRPTTPTSSYQPYTAEEATRSSGIPSSLGEAAAAWSGQRERLLRAASRPVACERFRDTGIAGYALGHGDEYCACPAGQAEEARLRRWYDEMHAEELAWRQRVLEERIAAFSARVLPGGVVPTLETLLPLEALTKVRAFVEARSEEQGLVLLGEVGVGKTTLLLALVRSLAARWVAARKVVRLVTVPDFLRELRAGYDAAQQKQGESYHELMERYQTCDVLVFDDLGAEKLTDWVEEQFYLLVDYRYRQRLPVLASSNCHKEALAQRLDRRVLDRLRETCTMIEVVGPNQRDRAVHRG